MRSGGCAVQQTLTAEAASVLKHSLILARRRGHAQVTPLHVAATLLSSRTSLLLRRACLKSQPHYNHHRHSSQHHHPLQCRALELCLNVSLNRLPTTPASLLLHGGQPSLSNALIAALKRAQAHQRRGCIENQHHHQPQHPLLTIKVEIEQLIISILDDPSVSRVMREAGFSSTAVKNHIEDESSASSVFQCYTTTTTSAGVFSSPSSPSDTQIINPIPNTFWQTHFLTRSSEQNPLLFSPQKKESSANSVKNKEDIESVFEVLLRKKKNTVIVGDCFSAIEGLVSELMRRLESGNDVPDELKKTHFIRFQFAPVTLRFMKKEDVEMNLTELKRKVEAALSTAEGGGAIIYTGDLKWTVDQENLNGDHQISCYSPVNHLVAEIRRLVSDFNGTSNSKVWLVATASYQTYRRCQMKEPPLEIQWALQAVSLPSGGLGLSLHASRVSFTCKEEAEDKLTCCGECISNYENEAAPLFKSNQQKILPPWLQSHNANSHQKEELVELKRKWNRLCHSLHHHQGRRHTQSLIGKSYSYASSSYPWWPNQSSIIFPDSNLNSISALNHKNSSHSVPKFRPQQSCTIELDFSNSTHKLQGAEEPNLDSLKSSEGKEVKITLSLGSSEFSGPGIQPAELCKALQETVPWQSETIPSIVDSVIGSRSSIQKETWLLIRGNDAIGKRRLALAMATLVFGSADLLFRVNMSERNRDDASELLVRSLKSHDELVVLVEDFHLADSKFMKLLADRFETRKFGESRDEKSGQKIFILAEGNSLSSSNYEDSVISMKLKIYGSKRKAEWDFPNKIKNPRVGGKEDESSTAIDNVSRKKGFSRQSSFTTTTIDLNMKFDDEGYESEENTGELSPVPSDLTRETAADHIHSNGFLDLIRNRFVFDRNSIDYKEIEGLFMSRLENHFEEVFGGKFGVIFRVEDRVLEEVFIGSSYFLNSLFDKWLKEVFQTSLNTVKYGGKGDGIRVIRLGCGGKIGNVTEGGFKDSCLPKNIQISSME